MQVLLVVVGLFIPITGELCTHSQFLDLSNAYTIASSTVKPTSFKKPEEFMSAIISSMKKTLGVANPAETYPCYPCMQAYVTSVYDCVAFRCTGQQSQQVAVSLTNCAVGLNLDRTMSPVRSKSSFTPDTVSIQGLITLSLAIIHLGYLR